MVEILAKPIPAPVIVKNGLTKTDTYGQERYKDSIGFKFQHETLKSRVLSILRGDKQARKDDFWLCLMIWIKSDNIKLVIPLEDYHKIYKPESISRIRRELIAEAKSGVKELQFLLNNEEILEERDDLEELNHNYYHDHKEKFKEGKDYE
jgi:hypothetical protein